MTQLPSMARSIGHFFHATGVVAHFASVVTAGRLVGLDGEVIAQAQGVAGSASTKPAFRTMPGIQSWMHC